MNMPEEQVTDAGADPTQATPVIATAPDRPHVGAGRQSVLATLAVLLLLSGLALVAFSLADRDDHNLYPNLPTFTPPAAVITGEPALVGFTELNADPAVYRDQRIQVSGVYVPLDVPACRPFAGPVIHWSLVNEELQLNAVGFEKVLSLVDEGTEMTVSGIWRFYQGPLGCGKEPADGNLWYLAVDQILEPNPLFGADGSALTVVAGSPQPTLPPLDLELEPTQPLTATMTLPATETLPATGTAAATLPGLVLTPTAAATPTVVSTPNLTGTPASTGTAVLTTPGSSPTPSPTLSGSETPTLELPTATSEGTSYPQSTIPPTDTPFVYD